MKEKKPDKLELMIIISNRGLADKVIAGISQYTAFPSVILSKGTASNEVMAALGIGEPEKDMVFCFSKYGNVQKIYNVLTDKLDFISKRLGIAMTIPVSAVGGKLTLKVLSGETRKNKTREKKA